MMALSRSPKPRIPTSRSSRRVPRSPPVLGRNYDVRTCAESQFSAYLGSSERAFSNLITLGVRVCATSRYDDGQALMISTQETRVAVRSDFDGPYLEGPYIEGMAWDLATVSGALSEIATTWRRALPCRPDLPLDLPQRLPGKGGGGGGGRRAVP